mmetsp:Transcript_14204/g.42968  ORF Transcript_14204/g.42968 Transcript_14204/m.42968 type:complete len:248 (-) Transcript_14204:623-1366(-)
MLRRVDRETAQSLADDRAREERHLADRSEPKHRRLLRAAAHADRRRLRLVHLPSQPALGVSRRREPARPTEELQARGAGRDGAVERQDGHALRRRRRQVERLGLPADRLDGPRFAARHAHTAQRRRRPRQALENRQLPRLQRRRTPRRRRPRHEQHLALPFFPVRLRLQRQVGRSLEAVPLRRGRALLGHSRGHRRQRRQPRRRRVLLRGTQSRRQARVRLVHQGQVPVPGIPQRRSCLVEKKTGGS